MSEVNPMQDVRDWLSAMPPKLRKSTAVFAAARLLRPDEYDASELLSDKGWEALDRWLLAEGDRGGAQAAASFLKARAVIRFFVIDHFCSKEGWNEIVRVNERMLEGPEESDGQWRGRESCEGVARTADLTGRQWRSAGEAWESQIEAAWSDARLRWWLNR